MSAKFPCVSKRPIVPGIIDLSKFIYEDLEEIVAGGQGSFEVYCRTQVVTNIHTYIHTYPLCLRHCFSQSKINKNTLH